MKIETNDIRTIFGSLLTARPIEALALSKRFQDHRVRIAVSPIPQKRRYFSVRETSEITGLSPSTLYRPRWKSRLGAIKAGGSVKYDIRKVDQFMVKNSIVKQT